MNTQEFSSVDHLEVMVLADNYTDMFMIQDTPVCLRPKVLPPLVFHAEHGFSCMVKVGNKFDEQTVLFDGSVSSDCVIHNAELLGINLPSVDTIVLSHGHPDHFLGIPGIVLQTLKKPHMFVHPDVFLTRRLNNPMNGPVNLPVLSEIELIEKGAVLQKSRDIQTIAGNKILLTGEIEKTNQYEIGFPWAEAKINGIWQNDPFKDEQALVINVRNKGLVIISGCAHAGIINTIHHAQKITGINKIHAIIGGFHLTGPLFEPIISPTIDDMERINPDYIIPMHCTGWYAITRFSSRMPDKVILSTVGTKYHFHSK